ncbi:BRO-N domain-containing protein [Nonomuraea bangladeshensis]|uniref:BRO-N domain-containing protein n=1 Tax=Nonomuraea bangladeshensis TaxID=404385 RepID=UPI003C301088
MNELQIFDNGEFEVCFTPAGDSFTVQAPGLARALGSRDANTLVANIPDDEKGYGLCRTPGGYQEVWHLTEPGFYRALGQRQLGRIKSPEMRAQVERFQRWLYHDVLPSLRRNGYYSLGSPKAVAGPDVDDMPDLLTWKETCWSIRRDYRVRVNVARLRRTLMAAGVLTQTFEPKAGFVECFWWTGSAHLVHTDAVPRLFFEYQRTERLLGLARRGHQRELVGPQQGELPLEGA